MLISIANTVVDENAMVVEFSYTVFAYAAMFGSCGLQQVTGVTLLARMEDREIIRVQAHLVSVVFWSDIARIGYC